VASFNLIARGICAYRLILLSGLFGFLFLLDILMALENQVLG